MLQTESWSTLSNNPAHGVVDATDRILENSNNPTHGVIDTTDRILENSNNPTHGVVDTSDRILEYIVKRSYPWSC